MHNARKAFPPHSSSTQFPRLPIHHLLLVFLIFCRFLLFLSFFFYILNTFFYSFFPLHIPSLPPSKMFGPFFLFLLHFSPEFLKQGQQLFHCLNSQICISSWDHFPENRSNYLLDITAWMAPQVLQIQHVLSWTKSTPPLSPKFPPLFNNMTFHPIIQARNLGANLNFFSLTS